MKISINLTEEHIKLLRVLRFEKIDERHYGVDNYILWACGLSSIWEDMAAILGYQDKVIAESREDPMGAICEKETQEHLEELDAFFVEHITDMEEILHSVLKVLNQANILALTMFICGNMRERSKIKIRCSSPYYTF